jgi:purine-cytosine permease-like protein
MNTPETSLQNWRTLTVLYVGSSICLPVIIIGQELCRIYGFYSALAAIVIGNALLFLLGMVATSIGTKGRRSTAEQALLIFGPVGGKLFATVMAITMMVWFAIQLQLMVESVKELIPLPTTLTIMLVGGLVTYCAKNGLAALGRMANLCAPLLALTLIWSVSQAPTPQLPAIGAWPNLRGISLVMATAIAMVIDIPTFFRYARSAYDSQVTNAVLFLCTLPVIEGLGVYLASAVPGHSILETLQGTGGTVWHIWIALFLLIAGWAANNANLFSAAVCAEAIAPTASEKSRIFLLGGMATLLACWGLMDNIETVLNGLGVAISAMGAVMFTTHLLRVLPGRRALTAWGVATAAGVTALADLVTMTTIPLMDAFITGVIATCLLTLLPVPGNRNEKAFN